MHVHYTRALTLRIDSMKLTLATRIFLGYAVVLVTFGAVSLFSVTEMHRNQQEIRLVSQLYLLFQDATAIDTFHKNREREFDRLVDEKNPDTRRALIRLSRLYFPSLMAERLAAGRERAADILRSALPADAPFVQELLQRFTDVGARYQAYEVAAERVSQSLEAEAPEPGQLKQQSSELAQLQAAIGGDIRFLRAALENRIRERVEAAERRERRTGLLIIALSVLAISVGLLATAISARTLKPVRTLIEGVSRIGRGDYTAQLGVRGADEIATLAHEFDAMAKSLREREAQLKEKQEALLRAEQLAAVGRISAQIAHEVRNPLSSIGLNVELLEEALAHAELGTADEAKEARDLLSAILREVDRLTEVTEQYLRMARLPKPQIAPEDVNDLLESVLDFSREELERAHVEVVKRLAPKPPLALADEGQLRQVFLNLLRNSREAMAGGGRLTVTSSTVGGEVEVVFSDTGRGMSEDVQERIFEPFFSTKENGTGLGLAVSRQIIQAHGGSIRCESTPGEGTTFVLRLPCAREEVAQAVVSLPRA